MREYAVQNGVPIIKDEGLAFLKNIIAVKNPKTIFSLNNQPNVDQSFCCYT